METKKNKKVSIYDIVFPFWFEVPDIFYSYSPILYRLTKEKDKYIKTIESYILTRYLKKIGAISQTQVIGYVKTIKLKNNNCLERLEDIYKNYRYRNGFKETYQYHYNIDDTITCNFGELVTFTKIPKHEWSELLGELYHDYCFYRGENIEIKERSSEFFESLKSKIYYDSIFNTIINDRYGYCCKDCNGDEDEYQIRHYIEQIHIHKEKIEHYKF